MKRIVRLMLVSGIALSTYLVSAAAEQRDGQPVALLTAQSTSGDLLGWRSFHEKTETRTVDVWKLADAVLVCKGTPKGYIYTEKDYGNFVLRLEWRWPPGKTPGKGGVLLRMSGQHKIWPKSLEAQINAGDAGDFWGLLGYSVSGPKERTKSSKHPQFGTLTNVKKTRTAEKPAGEWNQYEIIAADDTVTLKVNGKVVNQAVGCERTPGKICLTAEGDEIHFRNVRLTPITGNGNRGQAVGP